MPVEELTCRELVEIVTDYLEGALPAKQRIEFEKHLVMCDGCAIYLEHMRETIRLTGMLQEDQIPSSARDTLLEAFRGWKRSR
jgi:anti-sigma factor RsiW